MEEIALRHLIKLIIALLVISWLWHSGRAMLYRWFDHPAMASHSASAVLPQARFFRTSFSGVPSGEHFSPAENLERLDYDAIESARRSLDIAVYAFTDRLLASAVLDAARRGVQVRIYRDGEQYEEEQERAYRYGSTTDMFRGQPNIHIRVKRPSRVVMHEKLALIDDSLLRTGSANWSPGGEKRQDNDSCYVTDPGAIERFMQDFEAMWERPSNIIVQ